MSESDGSRTAPEPVVGLRECGGWLAISPPGARFGIGETGKTEQEAVERWAQAWRRWSETLAMPKESSDASVN